MAEVRCSLCYDINDNDFICQDCYQKLVKELDDMTQDRDRLENEVFELNRRIGELER